MGSPRPGREVVIFACRGLALPSSVTARFPLPVKAGHAALPGRYLYTSSKRARVVGGHGVVGRYPHAQRTRSRVRQSYHDVLSQRGRPEDAARKARPRMALAACTLYGLQWLLGMAMMLNTLYVVFFSSSLGASFQKKRCSNRLRSALADGVDKNTVLSNNVTPPSHFILRRPVPNNHPGEGARGRVSYQFGTLYPAAPSRELLSSPLGCCAPTCRSRFQPI